jgi:hypothetical protein
MSAVVGVASTDLLGGPAWDTQSERTAASQGIEMLNTYTVSAAMDNNSLSENEKD